MSDTLVLNSDGQPLSLLPLSAIRWQEAIRLSFMDKVHVVEYYDDWDVHSATQSFPVPAIIMAKRYIKRLNEVKLNRGNLYLRDEYTCQYCGDRHGFSDLTIDHVFPRSKGGGHNWKNVVAACKPCNHRKSSQIIEPLKKPYAPTYWDLTKKRLKAPVIIRHYSWERFIDAGDAGFKLIEPSEK